MIPHSPAVARTSACPLVPLGVPHGSLGLTHSCVCRHLTLFTQMLMRDSATRGDSWAGAEHKGASHHFATVVSVSPSVAWKLDGELGRTLRPRSAQQHPESNNTPQRQETITSSKRPRQSWQEKALSRGYCLTPRTSQAFRTPGSRVTFQLAGPLLKQAECRAQGTEPQPSYLPLRSAEGQQTQQRPASWKLGPQSAV